MWKSIISLKDQLVEDCGGQTEAMTLLRSWNSSDGHFSANAYDYLRLSSI